MILEAKIIPGAKKNLFKEENGRAKIYLAAPAVEGRANAALCDFLAGHFHVRSSKIEIIKGLKSRNKVIKIEGI